MPFDIQESVWGDVLVTVASAADFLPAVGRVHPDPTKVVELAALVAAAERPVVIGGRGAVMADAGLALPV